MDVRESPLFGLSMRQPPCHPHAEQALLGALLANNKAIDRVSEFLLPEHFADVIHGRIYREICGTISDGQLADAITLKQRFEHSGILDEVGGTAYLAQLLTAMVGIINAGEYGRVIHDAWLRRQLIQTGETLVNSAFGGELTAQEVAAEAAQALDGAIAGADPERQGVAFDVALDEALEAIDAAMKRDPATMFSTGLPSLDRALGGVEEDELWVLGARPGMGKTALAVQVALSAAKLGRKVLYVSLEMSRKQLARRVLSALAGVPVKEMRLGSVTVQEMTALVGAADSLRGLPLRLEDMSGLTPSMILMRARGARRRMGGLDMVIVDHLHIVRAEETATRSNNPTWIVGEISTAMKRMAKALRTRVLLLAQLKRLEGRDDKRPTMEDLRQSGNIEQDADAVSFLYRPEYYLGTSPPEKTLGQSDAVHLQAVNEWHQRKAALAGVTEVINAKVRDGEPSTTPLHFDGPTTSFHEVAQNG